MAEQRGGGGPQGHCEESLREFDRAMAGFRHAVAARAAPQREAGAPRYFDWATSGVQHDVGGHPTRSASPAGAVAYSVEGAELVTMDVFRELEWRVSQRLDAIEQRVNDALAKEATETQGRFTEIKGRHREACARVAKIPGGSMMRRAERDAEPIGNPLMTKEEMHNHVKLIHDIWREKSKDDILEELCNNLSCPTDPGIDEAPESLSHLLVAELCQGFLTETRYGGTDPPTGNMKDALIRMSRVIYTMTDVDIDRLCGFKCPDLPEGKEAPCDRDDFYKEYRHDVAKSIDAAGRRVQGLRNPEMYWEANNAMRTSADLMKGNTSDLTYEKRGEVMKWVKWICAFAALRPKPEAPIKVFRGLNNVSEDTLSKYANLKEGHTIYWAAASSTTDAEKVSRSYCTGTPVSKNVLFHLSDVTEFIPMSELSQYKNEHEFLLPPFTTLTVKEVHDNRQKDGMIEVHCKYKECLMPEDFRKECLNDLDAACRQLEKALTDQKHRAHMGPDLYNRIRDAVKGELEPVIGKVVGEVVGSRLEGLKGSLRKAGEELP